MKNRTIVNNFNGLKKTYCYIFIYIWFDDNYNKIPGLNVIRSNYSFSILNNFISLKKNVYNIIYQID